MNNDNKLKNYYPEKYKEHFRVFSGDGKKRRFNTHDFYWEDNKLQKVPQEHRNLFLYSFSLEVMLDEVMYTYFSFRQLKIDESSDNTSISSIYSYFSEVSCTPKINFCGHGVINRSPWSVLKVIENRNRDAFKYLIKDFLSYNKDKFNSDRNLPEWQITKTIIENDKDIHPLVRDIARGAITVSKKGV